MKKYSITVIITAVVIVILLIVLVFLKYILMWQAPYKNNKSLDKEANNQIKTLILSVMKDCHSKIYSLDKNILYTEEFLKNDSSSGAVRGLFINIDSKFMDTVEKTNENEYTVKVQLKWPDDWCYYFTISVVEEQYLVSFVGIDP